MMASLPDDVLKNMARHSLLMDVLCMERACKAWLASLRADSQLWKHLLLASIPRMCLLLEHMPLPHAYREICRDQLRAERLLGPTGSYVAKEPSAYIFTVELLHNNQIYAYNPGELVFKKMNGDGITYQFRRRIWDEQPDWFSEWDYLHMKGCADDHDIGLRIFVTCNGHTLRLYQCRNLYNFGAEKDAVRLTFTRLSLLYSGKYDTCSFTLLIHPVEPQRVYRSKLFFYYKKSPCTGTVQLNIRWEDAILVNEDHVEESAMRLLQRYLGGLPWLS